jgi:hypothetical protein
LLEISVSLTQFILENSHVVRLRLMRRGIVGVPFLCVIVLAASLGIEPSPLILPACCYTGVTLYTDAVFPWPLLRRDIVQVLRP